MSLIVFEHDALSNAGRLAVACGNQGHRLEVRKLAGGDSVPVDLDNVDGLIVMGGPMSVHDAAEHPWLNDEIAYIRRVHEAGLPVVGVCLGAQLVGAALGGEVTRLETPEAGWREVTQTFNGTIDALYAGIAWKTMQFHSHGWEVSTLPPNATPLASSAACRHQAYRVGLRTYGFQYHFEWNVEDIRRFSTGPLFEQAGVGPDEVNAGLREHYEAYRRAGERLSERIAMLLFAVDKR